MDASEYVGEQALLERCTSDGDISIDPDVLGEQPLLQEAMSGAGFTLKLDKNGRRQVGLWERAEQVGLITVEVEIDLTRATRSSRICLAGWRGVRDPRRPSATPLFVTSAHGPNCSIRVL